MVLIFHAGEHHEFYIEMACNGMFGNGVGIQAPAPDRTFTLKQAEVCFLLRKLRDHVLSLFGCTFSFLSSLFCSPVSLFRAIYLCSLSISLSVYTY